MKEWKWTIIALCCFGMLQSTISWILVIFDYETQRREAVLKQLLSSSPFLNNELIVFRRDTILQQQPTHIKSSPWNIVFPQTEKSLTLAFFRILFVLIAGIATDNIGYYIVLLICGMSSAISGLLWSFSDSLDTHELVWINSYRLFMQILSSIGSSSDVPTYLALSKCFLQSDYPTFIVACWLASRLTGIFIARAITTIHRRSNWPISKLLSNTNISNLPWRAFLIDTTSIHDSALLVIVVIISSTFIFFLSCCLYSKSSSSNSLYSINPQSLYYTECTQQTNFHVVDLSQQNQKTFVKIPYQSNQIKDLFKHPKFVGLPSDSILHSQFSWKIWLQHLLTKRNILIICFTISLSIAIQASHSDVFLRRLFGVTKHSKVQVTGGVVPSAQLWPYVGYVVSLIPLRISLNAFPLVSPTLQILLVTIISTPLIGLLADIALRWEFLAGIGLIMLVIGRSILRSSWSTLGHVILGIGLSSNWGCRGSALATNCLRGTEATSYAVLKCADFIGVATASYFISYFSTVTQLTTVTGIQFPPSGPFLAFAIFVVVSGILLFILSRQSSRRRSIVSSLHFPKRIDLENHDPDGNLDQHQIHLEIIDDQQSRRMLIEH